MTDTTAATAFVKGVFAPGTTTPIFVTSLPNGDAKDREPGEKHVMARDTAIIERHIAKWDRAHRGMFFCVGTLKPDARPDKPGGSPRNKANVAESTFAHADVDLKSVVQSAGEVIAAVKALPYPPSIIIHSGNGLHLYWLFSEPTKDFAAVEVMLRQLADVVGGDLSVAHCAALMRLPGTHNTKGGAWKPVEVIEADYSRTYEMADLEDMLAYVSPIVQRREPERRPGETNPFLAVAARLGFKPPIDVEQRLSAMSYQGAGDSAIHATQLSVSASLLSRGVEPGEVVATLLSATQAAAGLSGERWNWAREERAIRRMCEDWQRKNPAPPQPRAAPRAHRDGDSIHEEAREAVGGGSVVNLDAARRKKAARDKDEPAHIVLGTAIIEVIQGRGERLLVTADQVWHYVDGLWSSPMLDGKRWLDVEIEVGAKALGLASTNRLLNETRQWILRQPELFRQSVEWDAHGKIPTRSGLLDPMTLAVAAPRPEDYATWRIECAFEPASACPSWLAMLGDFLGDRAEDERNATIGTLQEVLGLALLEDKSKALTKALVLQGGSDSGKTTVLEVMAGLLSDAPISMPLDAIAGSHGLMEFTRRAPWVLNEAFDQSKWHFSALVKSILTGDPVQINIKNGPLITRRIKSPVFWGTNYPPQFKEATRAIVNRLIVIRCRQTFHETKPTGVALRARAAGYSEPAAFVLATEKSGLLNWAIEGLRRALVRGSIQLTQEIEDTRNEIRSDSNLVDGFIKECVDFSEDHMVSIADFCAAFTAWWQENKGENRGTPSNDSIGRAFASLGEARVCSPRDNSRRYYAGLRLNTPGLDYWAGAAAGNAAQGKTSRISSSRDDVNRAIPPSWDVNDDIVRIRKAAREAREASDANRDSSQAVTPGSVTDTSPRF